jgi:dTDP-glucose 4,6-dehydratase
VLRHTAELWQELRHANLFVTGGTGFFGRWMVESFLRANEEFDLQARVTILTRNPRRAAAGAPHAMTHPAVTLVPGNVTTFRYPDGEWTHVLHMATETDAPTGASLSRASFETAVLGTRRVVALARHRGVRKLLLTSSGAVYGPQPSACERVPEVHPGAPDPCDPAAGYAHGKRAAESLCAIAVAEWELQCKIARCFAFVGPSMLLNANFAIGNFIQDALHRDRIEVTGDGTPVRSYLYAADLCVWLWRILCEGEAGRPYNVGSPVPITIAALAHLVSEVVGTGRPVVVAGKPRIDAVRQRYVPDVSRAESELGLRVIVGLEDAVARTARWFAS